jgi:tRNA(Arg) A34 adenosine deaminase TadA
MYEALQEARIATLGGNYGVGCIITIGDLIIARGHNEIMTRGGCCWAHAEIMALRSIENSEYDTLTNYKKMTLYSTLAPCPQCYGAVMIRGIYKLVIGAQDEVSSNLDVDIPAIFDKPVIIYADSDIAGECENTFRASRVEIDKKLGYTL